MQKLGCFLFSQLVINATLFASDITVPLKLQNILQYEHKLLLLRNLGITVYYY